MEEEKTMKTVRETVNELIDANIVMMEAMVSMKTRIERLERELIDVKKVHS